VNGFKRSLMVVLGVAALAVPAGAVASNGQGKGHQGDHGKGKGHGLNEVAWVFKGYYEVGGLIDVKHGNSRVRKGGFVGQTVAFDLSGARIVVRDANGDGQRDLGDVAAGDWVLVKARLPRKDPGDQPFEAKRLIDKGSHHGKQGK